MGGKTYLEMPMEKQERDLPELLLKLLEEDGVFEFFEAGKIDEVKARVDWESLPYEVAEFDLLGQKYGIVMKESLAGALLDPSAGDADVLRRAGEKTNDVLKGAFSKRKLKPLESNFERTLFKSYVNSLLMNLFKYPTDEMNGETIETLGLNDREISKLYVNAAAAWLDTGDGLERITGTSGMASSAALNKVGYTGKSEKVDLSTERCHSGSHYTLTVRSSVRQIAVQIQAVQPTQSYLEAEEKIVGHILGNASDAVASRHAKNMVRLYLNLAKCYDAGKPLPLEWGNR